MYSEIEKRRRQIAARLEQAVNDNRAVLTADQRRKIDALNVNSDLLSIAFQATRLFLGPQPQPIPASTDRGIPFVLPGGTAIGDFSNNAAAGPEFRACANVPSLSAYIIRN